MKVDFTKNFLRQFKKLSPKDRQRFLERLEWFKIDPYDQRLRLHRLRGSKNNLYSIDVTGDLRALFQFDKKADPQVLFELIGTHSQLYG